MKIINNLISNKEIRIILIGNLLTFIFTFVLIKILTNYGKDQYGFYVLINSVINLINIYIGSFSQGFNRFYYLNNNSKGNKDFYDLFFSFFLFNIKLFFVLLLPSFFLMRSIFSSSNNILIFLAIIYTILYSLLSPLLSMLNNIRARFEYYSISALTSIILILSIIFFPIEKKDIINFYIFGNLTTLISIFSVITVLKRRGFIFSKSSFLNNIKKSNDVLIFSLPFIIWGFTGWLQSYGERWLIFKYLSIAIVGQYGLMASIANAGSSFIYGFTTQYYSPIIYQIYSSDETRIKKGRKIINSYYFFTLILLLGFLLFIVGFNKTIILFFSNQNYISNSYYLILITLSNILFYSGQTFSIKGLALNKPKNYLISKILPGLFLIFLGYVFVKKYELLGVIMAILLTNFIYVILILYSNFRMKEI